MMELFENLMRLHLEYLEKKALIREYNLKIQPIIRQIENRIETDMEETAEKIRKFEIQSTDGSRPATVRRLAERELESLREITFSASAEEREILDAEINAMEECHAEIIKLNKELGELFPKMFSELEEMRRQSHYDQGQSLYGNWISGYKGNLNRLCKEKHLEG